MLPVVFGPAVGEGVVDGGFLFQVGGAVRSEGRVIIGAPGDRKGRNPE